MYIVLDIGGTNLRISWHKELSATAKEIKVMKFPNTGNYNNDFDLIVRTIKRKSPNITSIAIGVPGHYNYKTNKLEIANNPHSRMKCTTSKLVDDSRCGLNC